MKRRKNLKSAIIGNCIRILPPFGRLNDNSIGLMKTIILIKFR